MNTATKANQSFVLDARAQSTVQAAAAMLGNIGMDSGDVVEVTATIGRNDSAILSLGESGKVFYKKIRGLGGQSRHARSTAFYDALDLDRLGFATPGLLATDDGKLSALYEYVDDGVDASQRFRAGELGRDEYTRLGSLVARLHSAVVIRRDRLDHGVPSLPPTGINAIPLEMYVQSTMGQLDMWKLLQGDERLRNALSCLISDGRMPGGFQCPVHGDLRLDQVVLGKSDWILDWEEFRFGDPARDLGGVLGELFYYRMRRIVENGDIDLASGMTHESVMRKGAELLEESLPDMHTVWRSYVSGRPSVADDDGFPSRCVAFFGWQLFDRALASGTAFGRVSALDRALAGIGREAMVGHSRYVRALGLELTK